MVGVQVVQQPGAVAGWQLAHGDGAASGVVIHPVGRVGRGNPHRILSKQKHPVTKLLGVLARIAPLLSACNSRQVS